MKNEIRKSFKIYTEKGFTSLNDILLDFVKGRTGDGLIHIFTRHTTCGIKIIENEILLLADIGNHFESIAPNNLKYLHDNIGIRDVPSTERINGVSHIRQLHITTSEMIPTSDDKLLLGEWQTVFLIELDPSRNREIILTYIKCD